MGTYASQTSVSSEKSRAEIESILARYGATHFGYMTSPTGAQVAFQYGNRQIKFTLLLPDRHDRVFTHHSRGARTASAAAEQYEQAVRQKWRALKLVVQAKLEAVESGISTFEQEFFAHTVLPNGYTVYEQMGNQVEVAIESGSVRPLSLEA